MMFVGNQEEGEMSEQCDFGLIGLAVMGQNLVLNMADHSFRVAAYNRTTSKVDEFLKGPAEGKPIVRVYSPEELVQILKRPRRIMMMVKAGQPDLSGGVHYVDSPRHATYVHHASFRAELERLRRKMAWPALAPGGFDALRVAANVEAARETAPEPPANASPEASG